jgi:hypothetical protein
MSRAVILAGVALALSLLTLGLASTSAQLPGPGVPPGVALVGDNVTGDVDCSAADPVSAVDASRSSVTWPSLPIPCPPCDIGTGGRRCRETDCNAR